jgi:hypothetical protein
MIIDLKQVRIYYPSRAEVHTVGEKYSKGLTGRDSVTLDSICVDTVEQIIRLNYSNGDRMVIGNVPYEGSEAQKCECIGDGSCYHMGCAKKRVK